MLCACIYIASPFFFFSIFFFTACLFVDLYRRRQYDNTKSVEKEFEQLDSEWNLVSNAEVVAIKAERYYYRHDPANACRYAMR